MRCPRTLLPAASSGGQNVLHPVAFPYGVIEAVPGGSARVTGSG
jgi:hypothetical protein